MQEQELFLSERREERRRLGEPAFRLPPPAKTGKRGQKSAANPKRKPVILAPRNPIPRNYHPQTTVYDTGHKGDKLRPPKTGTIHNAMRNQATLNIKHSQFGR